MQLAIYLSEDENICYSYDLNLDGTINSESEGILIELDRKILKRVNEYLKIDITDFTVWERELLLKNLFAEIGLINGVSYQKDTL